MCCKKGENEMMMRKTADELYVIGVDLEIQAYVEDELLSFRCQLDASDRLAETITFDRQAAFDFASHIAELAGQLPEPEDSQHNNEGVNEHER
jgi:hypothetical protein